MMIWRVWYGDKDAAVEKLACNSIKRGDEVAKKKTRIPAKLQIWIDARKRYRLTHAQIQMARELGLNPKKFGGYANHRQQRWKRPLGEYIEHLVRHEARYVHGARAPTANRGTVSLSP